ncbi:hypothetical protein TWF281_002390 [Arthrobotrys megalospora]
MATLDHEKEALGASSPGINPRDNTDGGTPRMWNWAGFKYPQPKTSRSRNVKLPDPPLFGAFGGPTYDSKRGDWSRCFRLAYTGQPVVPGGFPHAAFLQDPALRQCFLSSGRLWNRGNEHLESGFWVEQKVFISTLHFRQWKCERPSDKELIPYLDNKTLKIYVTDGNIDEDVDFDPAAPRVYLKAYDISQGLAIFLPVDPSYRAPNSIPLDQIMEKEDLNNLPQPLTKYDVFASGVNGEPPATLTEYIKPMLQSIMISDDWREELRTRDFQKMFLPNRRSVTYGRAVLSPERRILDLIPTAKTVEIGTTCPALCGYFGSFLALYNPTSSEETGLTHSYYVFGMLTGGDALKPYNGGNMIPDGFIDTIRSLLAEL